MKHAKDSISDRKKFKKIIFNKNNFKRFSDLEKLIENYNATLLNIQPETVQGLYNYYYYNSDVIYQYVRLLIDGNEFAASNEIRAIVGHLTESYLDKQMGDRELKNAYGHFRRMNLDMLKLLCDELDKALSWWMQEHYHYDYRKEDENFLPTFSENYVSAKRKYKRARLAESVGSDSKSNATNIIDLYYQAGCAYINLFAFYRKKHEMIEKKKRCAIIHYVCCTAVSILLIVAGFIPPIA